jgi:hypothetical protein
MVIEELLLACRHTPQAGGRPLVRCQRLLIQYIRSYPSQPEGITSVSDLRTCHDVMTSSSFSTRFALRALGGLPRSEAPITSYNHCILQAGDWTNTGGPLPRATGLPIFISPREPGWPSYTPRNWMLILVAFYDTHELRWGYSLLPATTRGRGDKRQNKYDEVN